MGGQNAKLSINRVAQTNATTEAVGDLVQKSALYGSAMELGIVTDNFIDHFNGSLELTNNDYVVDFASQGGFQMALDTDILALVLAFMNQQVTTEAIEAGDVFRHKLTFAGGTTPKFTTILFNDGVLDSKYIGSVFASLGLALGELSPPPHDNRGMMNFLVMGRDETANITSHPTLADLTPIFRSVTGARLGIQFTNTEKLTIVGEATGSNGAMGSWENTTGGSLDVTFSNLKVTGQALAQTLTIGVAATANGVHTDDIIVDFDATKANGDWDAEQYKGTGGDVTVTVAAGEFITATGSGDTTDFAGELEIFRDYSANCAGVSYALEQAIDARPMAGESLPSVFEILNMAQMITLRLRYTDVLFRDYIRNAQTNPKITPLHIFFKYFGEIVHASYTHKHEVKVEAYEAALNMQIPDRDPGVSIQTVNFNCKKDTTEERSVQVQIVNNIDTYL